MNGAAECRGSAVRRAPFQREGGHDGFIGAPGEADEPVAQIKCLLPKIPYGIFN
jgi:hypothetical protein